MDRTKGDAGFISRDEDVIEEVWDQEDPEFSEDLPPQPGEGGDPLA